MNLDPAAGWAFRPAPGFGAAIGIMQIAAPNPSATAAPADFEAPEREAAFFYGLFLRGHSYQQLRQDIDVPADVLDRWQRASRRDPRFASLADQALAYRRRVLAIFKSLVSTEGVAIQ
ncbi:MAG: hypothetical protein ACRD2E_07760 [Terriglobales bacterium]